MALSSDQIDILIDHYIMSLYTDLEDEVIADIARRVKKTGTYTETAELMAKSMMEQGYSPAEIRVKVMKYLRADKKFQMAVAENTKAYKEEVREIIRKIVQDAKKAGDELVAEAGEMSWNADLSMWEQHGTDLKKPSSLSQLKSAFASQTANELRNLTRTTGFRSTNVGTVGIMSAYQRELDLALLKVCTGVFSYDQAVQDCVHRLAQSGLRCIDYESGRTYQLDTAVRMAVRTACSQLSGKIMEENLKSSGQDLVITSQHMGSRPEHAPWQNKVFSYSGKSRKYPDFFKETGYGTVTGLKGVNCTHDFYPFWEGASVIPDDIKEPDPVTINGKEYTYYQCTQKQRSMERDIRAIKREIKATDDLDMDSSGLRSKLKLKTQEYRSFSYSANLKTRPERLRIVKSVTGSTRSYNGLSSKKGTYGNNSEKNIFVGTVDSVEAGAIQSVLRQYEKQIVNEKAENAIVITKSGEIYRCIGDLNGVYPEELGEKLIGSYVTHNHPIGSDNEYSFSGNDIELFYKYNLAILRGVDERFAYELNRNPEDIDELMNIFEIDEYSARHNIVIGEAMERGYGYRRKEREES